MIYYPEPIKKNDIFGVVATSSGLSLEWYQKRLDKAYLNLKKLGYTCYEMIDYEKRKDSGNERWKQVENRILQTEEKVESLEEEIRSWKN